MVPPIVHAEHRVARRLRHAGATSPGAARPLEEERPLDGRALRRLLDAGVVRDAGGGRFFLDEAAYAEFRAIRRKRALTAVAVIVVILAVLTLSGVLR